MSKHTTKEKDTEQSILEAAERLFLEKGFSLTTTTDIANEAGCNQALVHYYFRTKSKLFDAVFEKQYNQFYSILYKVVYEDIPFEDKLRRIIEFHFDSYMKNPKVLFLMINEVNTNPDRVKILHEKNEHNLKKYLSRLQSEIDVESKRGNVRPMSAWDLMITMFSLNTGSFILHNFMKERDDIQDEEIDLVLEKRKKENVRILLQSIKP